MDKPETQLLTAATVARLIEAFFAEGVSLSFSRTSWIWIDFSFSFLQLLHFQWMASLQPGQYSKPTISCPHALHNIDKVIFCLFIFKDYDRNVMMTIAITTPLYAPHNLPSANVITSFTETFFLFLPFIHTLSLFCVT
jgi:hypothetical protein